MTPEPADSGAEPGPAADPALAGTPAPAAPGAAEGVAVSIVIPAFNEASRFESSISRLQAAIAERAIDPATTEFIVVDDGSTDDTGDRARALLGGFPHASVRRLEHNSGKGAAIRAGIASATAPISLYMDADLAVDPVQVPKLIGPLVESSVSIGSRSVPGSSVENDSVHRTLMGRTFNRIVNAATHVSLGDTQCGFKAFRTPVARLLFQFSVIDRYAFDVELLCLARRFGMDIAEVPVRWTHVQGSRIRPLRDPVTMVYDVLASRLGWKATRPVPAALLTGGGSAASTAEVASMAARAVGPTLPVMPDHDGGVLVLFPLCPPAEVAGLCARLEAALPDRGLRHTELTAHELAAMAPLRLGPADGPPAPPAPPGTPGTSDGDNSAHGHGRRRGNGRGPSRPERPVVAEA